VARTAGEKRKEAPRRVGETPAPEERTETSARVEQIKRDIDELLDEIDEVLEENAEEFVRSYVQKGGE
jgi:ubiquitin-like protein Pup